MSQYLLLNRVRVQNANAVSGFTWGFPAITHFLGFTHNLHRKLKQHPYFKGFSLRGCAVIAHEHQVHSYKSSGGINFSQNKSAHYLELKFDKGRLKDPSVIEEAKMNMTVSLLIGFDGYVGSQEESFKEWIRKMSQIQRMAGGTVMDIDSVDLLDLGEESNLRSLKRKLLPGFILQDRSEYLADHFKKLQQQNPDAELIDAWLDFSALKQKARPKCGLIEKHLQKRWKDNPDNEKSEQLLTCWQNHKEEPYDQSNIPSLLTTYFSSLDEKTNNKLLEQWRSYYNPTEKTDAEWEYIKKPEKGYLVPIMTGYKAISQVYEKDTVIDARDNKTDVCFVESVHSVGEWQSIHRIKTAEALANSLWDYSPYEEHWYLCKRGIEHHKQDDATQASSIYE
ncbi:type I-F CRISPR-associated protein Csy2 [Sulfuriflexus sp.]|uniref:type I-F CRISPR-associated protein Csy2 n=1 Tax=Sulfuriflexus sp. TaxID=2015443 RepID=UPI0028CD3CAB|nr:type I-F CRISPR-associated protein Csy2 [Sulfuriflexus sp.]MDT8403254.1 type I-F CRISPR-associated protein Csy2 [Sulfuriflexus sp.]